MKNQVVEFLLVIAELKLAKTLENSLMKKSNDIMDEIKELEEYVLLMGGRVEKFALPLVTSFFVHDSTFICNLKGVLRYLPVVFKQPRIKASS